MRLATGYINSYCTHCYFCCKLCLCKESSYLCFVLTCSAFTQQSKSDWFNVSGDFEGSSHKPAVRPVTRPSSLSLSSHHTGCWCCPVCRLTRTRHSDGLPGPTRCSSRTDHVPRLLKDSLPLPLPSVDSDIHGTSDESITEVSVLSEDSYFSHDEETLVQSPSFRHFEVDPMTAVHALDHSRRLMRTFSLLLKCFFFSLFFCVCQYGSKYNCYSFRGRTN